MLLLDLFSISIDNHINVLQEFKLLHSIPYTPKTEETHLSDLLVNNQNSFYTGDEYGTISLWDIRAKDKALMQLTEHDDMITCMQFGKDNYYLITSSLDGSIGVYDIRKTGHLLYHA